MHTAAVIVTVVLDAWAPVSWTQTAPMTELISQLDPFSPECRLGVSIGTGVLGGVRQLDSIPRLLRTMRRYADDASPDAWTITDTVVMDYWESRDDELHWTPLFCPEVL